MFSARAYSFRQKSRLAISLSWVAGYTNVIVFMVCGVYVSHMTGNTTSIGKSIAEISGSGLLLFGSLWFSFFLGAVASALMTEAARRRGWASKYVWPLAVEAGLLLLVACAIAAHRGDPNIHVSSKAIIGCIAAFAMGLQNATITKISGAVVRTTHVTGVTTDLGIEGIQYLLWFLDRVRGSHGWARTSRMIRVSYRHPEFQRVALLATIWGSFVFGAIAGGLAFGWVGGMALSFPVAFLVWMIYVDWRTPIADMREIDLLADHELKLHGIVKSLLPPELGIWRVFCKRDGQIHKAPDFERWVEIVPPRWSVIILSLSPWTRLDGNTLLNLALAAKKLMDRNRRLILCGITPGQYRALVDSEVGRTIEHENICPDMEFAIARGIELVRQQQESALDAA